MLKLILQILQVSIYLIIYDVTFTNLFWCIKIATATCKLHLNNLNWQLTVANWK